MNILSNCTSGGCGAKIGPDDLKGMLEGLPVIKDENLLVGYHSSDDAAIYQLDDKTGIVSTMDFFSPMVEDPYTFGKIAATNALSDIYAMGADAIMALNMVCFPEKMDKEILKEILRGGANKMQEAGVVLAGGHSIYDKEIKYGLAVSGKVAIENILHNNTMEEGDVLILTKPLGVGIVMAAARVQAASEQAIQKAIASMERLNKYAAQILSAYPVHACTDVTGFGLLSHLYEMLQEHQSVCLDVHHLPYIEEAKTYAEEYYLTAGGQRNRKHMSPYIDIEHVSFAMQELLFDPQTSGGLLIAVAPKDASSLLTEIQKEDVHARIIGTVIAKASKSIICKEERR